MAERKRVRRNTLERRCLPKSFKRLFLGAPTWLKVLMIIAGILTSLGVLAFIRRRAARAPEIAFNSND